MATTRFVERRIQTTSTVLVAVALACLIGSSLVGCSTSSSSPPAVEAGSKISDERDYVYQQLRFRGEIATEVLFFTSVEQLLPNTNFTAPGVDPTPLTALTFVGRVVDVERGHGFYVTSDDADSVLTDFDDTKALWQTVHALVEVDEVVGDWGDTPKTVTVGLAVTPDVDFERYAQGLEQMGPTVFFLEKSPVFDYNESIYGVVRDGRLLAPLVDGRLTLPALPAKEAEKLLGGVETVDALKKASNEPIEIIEVDVAGEGLVIDE